MEAEIFHFATECPNCCNKATLNMKPTSKIYILCIVTLSLAIPFFQDVIIMALTCERCGYKTNEVKSGGAIKEQGCRLSVTLKEVGDFF